VLRRGYALILDPATGAPLTTVAKLKGKETIQVRLQDGSVHATLGTSIEQLSLLYGQKEA
jgi:exonuclease VII large subunit